MTPRKLLPNAAPKPKPAPPAKRQYSSIADRRTHSEKIAASQRLRSTTPPKRTNATRAAREFARCFHSVERVLFVQSLPCVATGSRGTTENAHVTDDGTKGAGRRSGYRCIAPLSRLAHELLHQDQTLFTERTGLTMEALAVCAAETEAQWLAFVADGGTT